MASLASQCFLLKKPINIDNASAVSSFARGNQFDKIKGGVIGRQFSSGYQGKKISCSYVSEKLMRHCSKINLRQCFKLSLVLHLSLVSLKFLVCVLVKLFL